MYCVVVQDCVLHIVSVYPLDGDGGGEPGIKGDGRCTEGWEKRGQIVGSPMGWEEGEIGENYASLHK